LNEARYVIRPKADQDLNDQAFHYATKASPEVGHRFLVSAHETFSRLATQPEMGWNPKLRLPELHGLRFFRLNGFEKMLILYRPLHPKSGSTASSQSPLRAIRTQREAAQFSEYPVQHEVPARPRL
jgi:toxin ParE1/3/4